MQWLESPPATRASAASSVSLSPSRPVSQPPPLAAARARDPGATISIRAETPAPDAMAAVRRAEVIRGSSEPPQSRRPPRLKPATRPSTAAEVAPGPSRMTSTDPEAAAVGELRPGRGGSTGSERMPPRHQVIPGVPRQLPIPTGLSDTPVESELTPRKNSVPAIRPAALAPAAPRDSDRPPRRATEGAPIIRVTIGRVEVRAVTPASRLAPKPVELRRPLLSLDDYLERRNAGRL